jgi:hypothetical protein
VPVPSGTAVGGKLQLWTDRSGDFTTVPLLDSQVAGQAVIGEVLGVTASAGVLGLTGALALRLLNKRRMAAWDADWQATGRAGQPAPEDAGCGLRDKGPARAGHPAVVTRPA